MTCAVSAAVREGSEAIICASTGNTAASAAAYAARAGLRCAVIVPDGKIATGKLAQALIHGARVIALNGNFDVALKLVRRLAATQPISLVNSVNEFRMEGQKTVGVRDRRGPRRRARRALHPGRQRRQHHRLLARLSGGRTAGRGCSASRPRAPRRSSTARPVEHPETVASAIRIGNPARWEDAMKAMTASGGAVRAVTDEQILSAYRLLASTEGIFCEPASAAGRRRPAGLRRRGRPAGRLRPDRQRPQGSGHRAWRRWAPSSPARPSSMPWSGRSSDDAWAGVGGCGCRPRPPTSGPGFDVMAAALALHLELEVVETGSFAVITDLDVPRTAPTWSCAPSSACTPPTGSSSASRPAFR